MHDHPQERDGLTENAIRLAYADRLAAAFEALENQNMTAALSAGSRALVYCVQAEAYDRLAALIYRRVAELGQDMQSSLSNYAICFRRAHAAGTTLAVPRVADLLADPAFDPLARWLRGRQVDVDELQAAVDQLLEQVRQNAIG